MNNKSMGTFLAELRKEKGITQRELAEFLNVSDKTISHWERDENSPDLSVIPILAEYFGVSCDELIKGERSSENSPSDSHSSSNLTYDSENFVKNLNKEKISKAYSKHKILCTVAVFISFFSLLLLTGIILFIDRLIGFVLVYEAVIACVIFSLALCLLITFISKQNFTAALHVSEIEISEKNKLKRKANFVCVFPLIYTAIVIFILAAIILPSPFAKVQEHETMTIPSSVEPNASSTAPYDDADASVPFTGSISVY